MIHLDSILLDAFYKENKDFFENARVQKIQQPTRREVILFLRNKGESRKFYININPQFYHVCFTTPKTEKRRNIKIPKQPPMFCMLLRKHIEGAKILKANMPAFERIIELYFENYNELGDRTEECLSIELMGKHSNIVLYNSDNNIILGCAHNIGEEKSKERELTGGLPYIYPPKQDKKNLLQTRFDWFKSTLAKSDESIKKTLNQKYFSLSQAVIEEICEKNGINPQKPSNELIEEEMQKLFIALHEFLEKDNKKFTISKDFEKYSCINSLEYNYDSVNTLIDDYFSFNIEKNLVSNMKSNITTKLNKELKKLKNTYANQKKQLEKKDKFELYLKKGNLLTANAYAIKNSSKNVSPKSIYLTDYETNEQIEIELDETKSIIENAQRYFALYNKGKKAFQVAEEMSKSTLESIDYYNQILYDTDISDNIEDLEEISKELEPEKQTKKLSNIKENTINVEKRTIDNMTVFIGKNNKQNDYLYSKISSPNDLWFHVLNTPGSHIIAKPNDNSSEIKDETILKIAQIAKEFSTAKNSTKVAVVYTLRKHIKRPQNTKSGFVVYKNETEIVVN